MDDNTAFVMILLVIASPVILLCLALVIACWRDKR